MSSSARYLSLKEAAALAEVPEDTILFWKKESLLKFIEESSEVLFCKRFFLRRLKEKDSLPLPSSINDSEEVCKVLSTLTPLAKALEWKRKKGWLWSKCGRFIICPGVGKGEDATAELWSQSGDDRGTLLSSWAHLRNAKIWATRLSVQRQWR